MIPTFAELKLHSSLLTALHKASFEKPTPIQAESIPPALSGVDLIGIAQTGSGKTLAYALSVFELLAKKTDSRALVLSPNRETADQVFRTFELLNGHAPTGPADAPASAPLSISMCLAAPGMPMDKLNSQLKKVPRLIVATPGRINEVLQKNKLLLKGLEILVIDEADRMLSLGFEPQLKFIKSTLRGEIQTMMFAASFSKNVEPLAKMFLKDSAITIKSAASETPVSTLSQKVFFLNRSQKNNRLRDELKKMKGGIIIFADRQENCTQLGRFLEHHEFKSDFVHGDMNPGHRGRVLREFREEKFQILVTTDLLARGLDVPHIKHVVNYDLPYKAEDFLHRIGRTARAGREGSALTFITPSDERTYRKIKIYLKGAEEEKLMANFKFDQDPTGSAKA